MGCIMASFLSTMSDSWKCGPNGVCSYIPNLGRKCSCIPGYKMKNPADWTFGCEPEIDLPCNQSDQFGFLKLRHVEFYGNDYDSYPNYTIKMCEDLCLSMCGCKGFQFKYFNSFEGDLYLKLPKASLSSFNKRTNQDCKQNCSMKFEELDQVIEACPLYSGPARGYFATKASFRELTYAELKKATKAIKKLIDANHQGQTDLLAEVNIIGRLHHMNVIEMWGYCIDGKHRLLVYEYMEHGSLAKGRSFDSIDGKNRFKIAVETAKGLAYLHEECLEGDVKYSGFSRIRETRGYMAPEWVSSLLITSKVDVHSYGIVLLELVTGRKPAMGVHSSIDGEGGEDQRTLVTWVREQMKRAETWTGCPEMIDPALDGKYDIADRPCIGMKHGQGVPR
ncbi:hypothetical protein CRYUN_Cryun39dG0071900 [Craigia yunnanensis]